VFEGIAGDALGLMWSLSDRVLVTDLPPPYTIGEENLTGLSMSRIIEFTGFTVPRVRVDERRIQKAKSALGLDNRPLIFLPISGPDITKGAFTRILLRAGEELARRYNVVISMGIAGGSTEPRRIAGGGWMFDWCPIKDELFDLSQAVVARAGLSTIAQCIDRLKPAVLVPIRNHPEQISNAEKFSRLGLGVAVKSERLTPQKLTEYVDSCTTDSSYRSKLEIVSAVSMRYSGVERCADIVSGMT
jgi:UDP:flavonoid glycosyltransferase YjiC (YdhE family)